MNFGAPEFYSGIEPAGCDVYLWEIPFWNWTTIFPHKTLILTLNWLQNTHGYLYTPPGTLSLLFSLRIFLRIGIKTLWRGVDLWSRGLSNSILELNQVAVMFFSRKFHSGIEPFFSSRNDHFWPKVGVLDTVPPNKENPRCPSGLLSLFFVAF